ncbi:MAG: type I methionyl aminopeptidase [Clostridia bacterium]|nr:type I methionyl aminopeptidase [Clostridia bacterium]
MVTLKNSSEIEKMKAAGEIAITALYKARELIKPGVTTFFLDEVIRKHIVASGAKPSFLGYGGFPASACISVNDKIIHGIPSREEILKEGDIVSIDVGACYKGFHGDCARTYGVGEISDNAKMLIDVTRESFFVGIKKAIVGNRMGDLGNAIYSYAEKFGYGVVEDYTGHGIGRALHEDPGVPNYGTAGRGIRFQEGMTLAVEPMINEGTKDFYILEDKWSVMTMDHKLSAHYENTIVVTGDEPVILTKV